MADVASAPYVSWGEPRPSLSPVSARRRAAAGAHDPGAAIEQDGWIDPVARVAELTGLWRRAGWPEGLRYIARRVKPGRGHAKKLTEFNKAAGWRYQPVVTNIRDLGRGVPGSHHVYFHDTLHRQHAVLEDQVRTEKATGIRNLPCHGFARNQAWLPAANLASDLIAHLQPLRKRQPQ